MTPANRRFVIWSGLVLAAIVGSATWYQWGRVTRVPLLPQARLVDDDLARMQLAFGRAGLNDFEIRNRQIYVDRTKQDLYLKALAENQALPDISHSLYEPEASVDFWSNRQQQHEKSLVRKKKMIRQMILQLEFVADAHVDLDELTEAGFPPKTTRKVAVVVRSRGDRILERHQVRAIRDTVLGQVAGLDPQDVVITDIAAGHAYSADSLDEALTQTSESLVWLERARLAQRLSDWLTRYTSSADIHIALVESEPNPVAASPEANAAPRTGAPQVSVEPSATVIVNQPVAIPDSVATTEALPGPAQATAAIPAVQKSYLINATVRIPCDCAPSQGAASQPLVESQRHQLEQTIAAELQPLLVSESLSCRLGALEVLIEPLPLATEQLDRDSLGAAWGWTRKNSFLVLVTAGVVLLATVAWLFRPRGEPESATATMREYSPRSWETRERTPQIPLNDETRRRLRQVVSDDPDRAAEIIKNWIRDAA